MNIGNAVIEQFVPWYSGVAFAFYICLHTMLDFLTCLNLHVVLVFDDDDVPRIEADAWYKLCLDVL